MFITINIIDGKTYTKRLCAKIQHKIAILCVFLYKNFLLHQFMPIKWKKKRSDLDVCRPAFLLCYKIMAMSPPDPSLIFFFKVFFNLLAAFFGFNAVFSLITSPTID